MKSILYVGATLMIGASIYGFVDYKQTSHKKEFTALYEEEKDEPVFIVSKKITEPVEKKDVIAEVKKTKAKKKAIRKEEALESIKPIEENEKMVTREMKKIDYPTDDIKVAKESSIEKKMTKKRKFSTKFFSRGALDERYTDSKEKKKGSKTVTEKTETKE